VLEQQAPDTAEQGPAGGGEAGDEQRAAEQHPPPPTRRRLGDHWVGRVVLRPLAAAAADADGAPRSSRHPRRGLGLRGQVGAGQAGDERRRAAWRAARPPPVVPEVEVLGVELMPGRAFA
jgi:hypothetical protein